MSGDLTAWVGRRLDQDTSLADEAKLLVLAALEGDGALADMAGYQRPVVDTDSVSTPEPVGAFLKQIKVRGFRGVGPEAQLDLTPQPSLTVVSGRNGSGKSSFAEAFEVALTGHVSRWDHTTQWRERWRNLHAPDPARIDVTLTEETVGTTRITVAWPPDGALDDCAITLQRQGRRVESGVAGLGWDGPLVTYRPLLTYEDLGRLLRAEPSALYDALSTVLGLGQLADAVNALNEHRKSLTAPESSLRKQKRTLTEALGGIDDERAGEAVRLLKPKRPDVASLRRLATGTAGDSGVAARVRELTAISLPSEQECSAAAAELKASLMGLADLGGSVSEELQRRGQLITAALAIHDHVGDGRCPVCGTGMLDADRVRLLGAELEQSQHDLSAMRQAGERCASARAAARQLVRDVPPVLAAGLPQEVSEQVAALASAWSAWAVEPADPLALADHLVTASGPVRAALDELRSAAQQHVQARDEAWSRVAVQLGVYADEAETWEQQRLDAETAVAAYIWLKDHEIVLKNERVQPIAAQAKHIWAAMRQESNVEIAGLSLESSNTRRHVEIRAEVDGEDAGALSVMSQGELHALALALFLPRATMPASPFRFVVLDDPVQAMDPAKVDGLVQVLLEIAKTRQVVVFSHDDRFASAVRRAPHDVPVSVLEVVRQPGSEVMTRVSFSPAERFLRDAFGLAKDSELPAETRDRVMPGLLRLAIEAQARDTYFARELARGVALDVVERIWNEAGKTRDRLALALGDPTGVDTWLSKANHRRRALRHGNRMHDRLDAERPIDACRDVEETIRDLRGGVR